MKTLVIHPNDKSTDFLFNIYCNIDCNSITDYYADDNEIIEQIKKHERIILLGHGSPSGLFSGYGTIINETHIKYLKEKMCIGIWCHCNEFFEKYNLKGYSSSMFISEKYESEYYGITTTQRKIDRSNYMFATLMAIYLDEYNMMEKIKEKYNIDCDVVQYNRKGLRTYI